MPYALISILLALILFILAGFNVSGPRGTSLTAFGLAFLTLYIILTQGVTG